MYSLQSLVFVLLIFAWTLNFCKQIFMVEFSSLWSLCDSHTGVLLCWCVRIHRQALKEPQLQVSNWSFHSNSLVWFGLVKMEPQDLYDECVWMYFDRGLPTFSGAIWLARWLLLGRKWNGRKLCWNKFAFSLLVILISKYIIHILIFCIIFPSESEKCILTCTGIYSKNKCEEGWPWGHS